MLSVLSLLLVVPGCCQAKDACPWINGPTAFGILGVGVGMPGKMFSDITATACRFSYKDRGTERELLITMEAAQHPAQGLRAGKERCQSRPQPVRGIGNEAALCAVSSRPHMLAEQVVARVRENVFIVTVSTSAGNTSKIRQALEQQAEDAAGQIAGGLF